MKNRFFFKVGCFDGFSSFQGVRFLKINVECETSFLQATGWQFSLEICGKGTNKSTFNLAPLTLENRYIILKRDRFFYLPTSCRYRLRYKCSKTWMEK